MSAPVLFKKLTPSQINLIKNAKNHFLLMKKLKNTESAQLWLEVIAYHPDVTVSVIVVVCFNLIQLYVFYWIFFVWFLIVPQPYQIYKRLYCIGIK